CLRVPRPQSARRALSRLRNADRARGLRGAHDLLLPALPDAGPPAQGPPPLAPPPLERRWYGEPVSKLAEQDLQASPPEIALSLSRAGVTGVQKAVWIRRGDAQTVMAAVIDCTVDLAADQKGVHMSRFPELFEEAIDLVVEREALLV